MKKASVWAAVAVRALFAPALLLPALAPAFSEGALVIRNEEELPFHYALDPAELAGLDPATLSFRMRLVDYFLEESPDWPFALVPPREEARLDGLPAGRHLLVGFFELPGSAYYPVSFWEVEVGEDAGASPGAGGPASLSVRREPGVISVRSGEGRLLRRPPAAAAAAQGGAAALPAPAIRVDRRYEDWEPIPSLAAFSGFFEPASFTRESVRGWEVLPLVHSRYWRAGGTQLNEIKVLIDAREIYFFISTQSAISDRLSIFIYFQDRPGEPAAVSGEPGAASAGGAAASGGARNRVTLELVPADAELPGVVLLWKRGEGAAAKPQPVGRLLSGDFFIEGRVSRRLLEDALGQAVGPQTFFDLTTCYFERSTGVYEEFYFTSVHLRDIPRRE